MADAIWDLVWAGLLTNDTLGPLRVLLGGQQRRAAAPARAVPRPRPGRAFGTGRRYGFGRPSMPTRTGPPTVSGRWSLLPSRHDADPTQRAHALALTLLERHGVLTRGAVAAERITGGFAAVYPVLRAMEEAGQCRRGYFVEGLGGAQFALPGAVDRMRALADPTGQAWVVPPGEDIRPERALVLAAADPAQPYGAALPWPDRPGETASSHRPGRKAGALVVLVEGSLALYVERGGRTLLSWTDDPERLAASAVALAAAVRDGALGRLTVERADGERAGGDSPLTQALEAAGFRPTPARAPAAGRVRLPRSSGGDVRAPHGGAAGQVWWPRNDGIPCGGIMTDNHPARAGPMIGAAAASIPTSSSPASSTTARARPVPPDQARATPGQAGSGYGRPATGGAGRPVRPGPGTPGQGAAGPGPADRPDLAGHTGTGRPGQGGPG